MPLTTRQRIDALIAAHEGLRTSVRHDLGVTVDGDTFYVADTKNHRIQSAPLLVFPLPAAR